MAVKVKLSIQTYWLLFVFLPLALCNPLSAQDGATSQPPEQKYFRIGHMSGDPEGALGEEVFGKLKDYLMSRDAVTSAMAENNITGGIIVQSADSHQGLIEWMDQDQVDLAFCSSVDFVRQKGNYEPVFQLRRPGDAFDPRGSRIFHRGEIFVNNRSEFFRAKDTTPSLGEMLAGKPVAMVESAAGYYYPILKIADSTSATQPCQPVFCTSSEEVVKSVLNGVTNIGACDQGVIDEVLEHSGLIAKKNDLVRILAATDPIPTDPVAINEKWFPHQSALGREISEGVRQFFSEDKNLPALMPSSRGKYDDLRQNLDRINALARSRAAAQQRLNRGGRPE